MKFDRKNLSGYGITIILILFSFSLIAASKKRTDTVSFDFKKTRAFVHEMDTRPDFPVAITLMRDYVYSVQALGETIEPKRKNMMLDFAKKIQQPDGGFSIDIATKKSDSLYTDCTIESLAFLGALNTIDAVKAKSYLASLKKTDGGFGYDSNTKESSLAATYYAIHSLSIIKGLDTVDKQKTTDYIKGFEKAETGGFSYVKKTGISTAKDTYMAVYVLKTLGKLDEVTKNNAVKYLTSTPYIGKAAKYEQSQTLEESAKALMAMRVLGAANKIKKDMAVAFIKTLYIPENGGFGPIIGYGSAPDPTYFGIRGLAELGVLKKPAESPLK